MEWNGSPSPIEWNGFISVFGMGYGLIPDFVWLEGWDGMNMVQVISCIERVRLPLPPAFSYV